MRAHAAEYLGTLVLVFVGCGAIAVGTLDALGVALAFGLVIAVLVLVLGPVSGAHLNPAVSVALAAIGLVRWTRAATYALAQAGGAITGALLLRLALGPSAPLGVTAPAPSLGIGPALVFEVALTFVLVLVIAAVVTAPGGVPLIAPVAIGGAVALGSLVGGPVSGAAMNPARALGPALVAGRPEDLWLYAVGPLAGALLAALVHGTLVRAHARQPREAVVTLVGEAPSGLVSPEHALPARPGTWPR